MFNELLKSHKLVIGMIHLDALPGTPKYKGNVREIIKKALDEAEIYSEAGVDSVMIENMHDVPYLKKYAGPETVSLMSIIGYEIKNKTNMPAGIQILAGANKEAIAAAHAAGLDFVRVEGFVFAHTADEGIMESDAGELLRYRKMIGAENISVLTDIKKKHSSHTITSDVNIIETAKAAEFFLSDGIIITGKSTSEETDLSELKAVKPEINIPVLIGSGITLENIEKYYHSADGFIVGSYFKKDGYWKNGVDKERVAKFMDKIHSFI